MKGVIIAGGKGLRLRPVTFEMAKALIPVHGRPLIDHAIDLFWKYKVYEIWLSLGWYEEQIRQKYPYPFWLDRDLTSGRIVSLGTGGWLNRLAQSTAKEMFNEDFFVCNSDNLFNLNLNEMKKLHREKQYVVTIACTRVPDVRDYGSVHISNGKVQSFEEKKNSRVKKSGWINGGYYLFSPKVFEYVKKLNIDINRPLSLENDLFPLLAKEGVLGAYESTGQWFDTGTFDRWEKAIKEWREIKDD